MLFNEYCDAVNATLTITRYPKERWSAGIKGAEVKEGSMLVGAYGAGGTPGEAVRNYIDKIEGKTLVFNATDITRRLELQVPQDMTYKGE